MDTACAASTSPHARGAHGGSDGGCAAGERGRRRRGRWTMGGSMKIQRTATRVEFVSRSFALGVGVCYGISSWSMIDV